MSGGGGEAPRPSPWSPVSVLLRGARDRDARVGDRHDRGAREPACLRMGAGEKLESLIREERRRANKQKNKLSGKKRKLKILQKKVIHFH